MNFPPWNIVRKDFRLTRPYLLAWWGILAVGARLTVWNLNKIMQEPGAFYSSVHNNFIFDPNYTEELPYLSNWLFMGLDLVLLAIIVDLVVKADSPIDERAVWRTRPVSGLGVWRAKLLYLGLFCYLVPGTIQASQLIALGSNWNYFLEGLARFVVLQSLLVAIVASAAVLFQRTFSGLLTYGGVAVLAIILVYECDYLSALAPMAALFYDGLPVAWVVLVILGLTGLWVSALIYAGCRRKIGAFALGGGVLAALAAFFAGTFHPYALPAAPQLDNRVQIAFDSHPVSGMGWAGDRSRLELSAKISLRGAPDTVLQMDEVKSTVTWPGTILPLVKTDQSELRLINLANTLAAAGYGRLLGDEGDDYPAASLVLPKDALAQVAGQPARWQGTLTGEVGYLVKDWEAPLAQGSWLPNMYKLHTSDYFNVGPKDGAIWNYNQSWYKIETGSVAQWSGELSLSLWEASPANLPWMNLPRIENRSRVLLLYNPARKEAILGGVVSYGNSASTRDSFSLYAIDSHLAFFNLAEIFGDKYPIYPDAATMTTLDANGDTAATRAYLQTWQRDLNAFLTQHSPEIIRWMAGARLVELHFVPDYAVYNTATIALPQIITPDVARGTGISPP